MKLPKPSWFYLNQAIDWLMERGVPERQVKQRLYQAFRDGEVETWGRSRKFFRNENRNRIKPKFWDRHSFDWDSSSMFFLHEMLGNIDINGIEIRRDDLVKWLKNNTTDDASRGESEMPVYRSPYMKLMLAAEAHFGSRLDSSGDYAMKDEIERWLEEHWAEFISTPMTNNLKKHMATLIRDPKLGKGGNKRWK